MRRTVSLVVDHLTRYDTRRSAARQGVRPLFALLPLSVPLVLAAATLSFTDATVPAELPRIRYDQARRTDYPLPNHSVLLPIQRGDALETVIMAAGVSQSDANGLAREFATYVDPRAIRVGESVRVEYGPGDQVQRIAIRVGSKGTVEAQRAKTGFSVNFQSAMVTAEQIRVAGTIETSFYEALQQSGESPALAAQLVDIFQWDVDFFRLRKGDSFSLIVEKQYADGIHSGYGAVTAARFQHDGQTFEAFRFEDGKGGAGYYATNGTTLRKEFLRAPLKFSRITSGYSNRRFHPVLKVFRAHPGIDYGAPVGTPVMATADGTVVSAGYGRGEGNMVRLRHTRNMETCYLHLSRFAKGVRAGSRVAQGQVIGYVGATGLATGPHLDYRMRVNGDWINPLKLKAVAAEPLRGRDLEQFRQQVARTRSLLSSPERRLAALVAPPSR